MSDPPNLPNPGKPQIHRFDAKRGPRNGRLANLSYLRGRRRLLENTGGNPSTSSFKFDRYDRFAKGPNGAGFCVANLRSRGLPEKAGGLPARSACKQPQAAFIRRGNFTHRQLRQFVTEQPRGDYLVAPPLSKSERWIDLPRALDARSNIETRPQDRPCGGPTGKLHVTAGALVRVRRRRPGANERRRAERQSSGEVPTCLI